jgi:hypothetical protein
LFREWDPHVAFSQASHYVKDIAISNFKVKRDSLGLVFNWNISWPINNLVFTLYRSFDNKMFKAVNSITATTDTTINFELRDKMPGQGDTYYYYLKASHRGQRSDKTDTWKVVGDKLLLLN